MSHEEHESVKRELEQTKNKKKAFYFFKGFLITYGVLIILTIISIIIWENISAKDYNTLHIGYYSSLVLLGIIASMMGVCIRNKNPYLSMGMIAAIFGPVFLIIKTDGEQLVEPYTEQPKKKRSHFLIGFLLSIGWGIFYAPFIVIGVLIVVDMYIIGLSGGFVVSFIIVLNGFIGLRRFFFKEKFRYISIGMIISFPLGIISIYLITRIMFVEVF